MIAYFDSSSIVKWFFDEPLMELAREIKAKADLCVTSPLSLPEVTSAMNRAWKEKRCTKSDVELVQGEFLRVWPDFQRIHVTDSLMEQSAALVFKHNLKAFDAVHLASALVLNSENSGTEVFFSCFDKNLDRAAYRGGFLVHGQFP